jgi:two-component system, response regulator / RNA-binding antiterminator
MTSESNKAKPGLPDASDATLKIVVVDANPARAAILDSGLRDAGYRQIVTFDGTANLLQKIVAVEPDVILIDLENPSRDTLEQMFQVSRVVKRPVAMFVDQADTRAIQTAVEAGVSAYVVDGLKRERVKGILDLCVSQFNAFAKLQAELDQARSALEERKIVDRAKGLVMKLKGLSEEDAYALMRRTAMNEKKKMSEIAQSIITAAELLR